MYGVLMVAMILLLRSVTATIATMMVIGLSAATAMGFAGWADVLLTPPSVTAPTIILTIAIADSVHILISMRQQMRLGASRLDAIVESLRINFQPIFLTSLTTIIGFMALNFSDSPPYWHLGNILISYSWVACKSFVVTCMQVTYLIMQVLIVSHLCGAPRLLASCLI
jgi:hypothetical protein